MAKRIKVRPPEKDNDDLLILFITCIFEHTRFSIFKDGPNLFEIKNLLLCVYGRDLTLNDVADLFLTSRKGGLVDMHEGKLSLTQTGRNHFHIKKRSIIPPQTVAQPERRKLI